MKNPTSPTLIEQIRRAARQEQFLNVLSREEAERRFHAALTLRPLAPEPVGIFAAIGRVVAETVSARMDAPPFDRALVDGFALRAADSAGATDATPRDLVLNAEVLTCGAVPAVTVAAGTATAIATGAVMPRGADAVVMIEQTELVEAAAGDPMVSIRRAASPGQFVGFAASDIARGETLLRPGTVIGSREIGMLAAAGLAEIPVVRRPRVAVLSTGDELVPAGRAPLPRGAIHDSNGAIIAAAVTENGGEALPMGIIPDDEAALEQAVREALAIADMVVLSGGTSKGAGDVSHRILSRLGPPGIVAHGVALKPGKPLCLAVAAGRPVVVLPGFPTSAIFTFHEFVVPVIRALAGLPPQAEAAVTATLAVRTPSELGRTEYVMVSLADSPAGGLAAWPLGRGSGAVTAFSQADGFFAIDALSQGTDAGAQVSVHIIGSAAPHLPDLVVIGSHCVGLDAILDLLARRGVRARALAVGSLGGFAAARRGECDIAPAHLLDPDTGRYNAPYLEPGLSLVPGWRRLQGIVVRADDERFTGCDAEEAVRRALGDPSSVMVNRNAGSGTRMLIDGLLGAARPPGHANQPKSHNAVAAAVAQGRADWGMAIETVARAYGLGFIPVADEHYDLFIPTARLERRPVQSFLEVLRSDEGRGALRDLGFVPADP
jgi:putative molybdopterin biosynthesis protein